MTAPTATARLAWVEFVRCVDDLYDDSCTQPDRIGCLGKDTIRRDLNAVHAAWVAFAQMEPCEARPPVGPCPECRGDLTERFDGQGEPWCACQTCGHIWPEPEPTAMSARATMLAESSGNAPDVGERR